MQNYKNFLNLHKDIEIISNNDQIPTLDFSMDFQIIE